MQLNIRIFILNTELHPEVTICLTIDLFDFKESILFCNDI